MLLQVLAVCIEAADQDIACTCGVLGVTLRLSASLHGGLKLTGIHSPLHASTECWGSLSSGTLSGSRC